MQAKVKAKGSFYIKPSSNKKSWFLYFQEYINGKKKQTPVPKLTYSEYGFKESFTTEEARKRAKQLNGINKEEKIKIKNAAQNFIRLQTIDKLIFPESEVLEFQQRLDDENVGSDKHLDKIYTHFRFVQKMLKDLQLLNPQEYKAEQKRIYKHLAKKKVSLNYSKRLISLLNRWGRFQSRKKGLFFEDVQPPRNQFATNITDNQRTKKGKNSSYGVRTESSPLTPEILDKLKPNLPIEQYNWLFISMWLGLRPGEVDSLHNPKNYKFEYERHAKINVIKVYQSKLKSISHEKRWKTIPLIFPEQTELEQIIESKVFKRPLNKTIKKYSSDYNLTLYGGRKNFVDMCLDAEQDYVDIAAWMGHKDTSTTFKHYKRRDIVRYKPLRKSA